MLGIAVLAAALSRFLLVELKRWEQLLCLASAVLLIAPGLWVTLAGVVIVLPVLARQLAAARRQAALTPGLDVGYR